MIVVQLQTGTRTALLDQNIGLWVEKGNLRVVKWPSLFIKEAEGHEMRYDSLRVLLAPVVSHSQSTFANRPFPNLLQLRFPLRTDLCRDE